MNYFQVTESISDFEGFINRSAKFSGAFGDWARKATWPICLECNRCSSYFNLEKHCVNGKSGIWLGSAEFFLALLLECPHCKKSGLYQLCSKEPI